MESGLNQLDQGTGVKFCFMCGAIDGDFWETRPTRPVVLRLRQRYSDITQFWILCDECDEGLQDLIHQRLFSQAKSQKR